MDYLEKAKEILEKQSQEDKIHNSKASAIAPYVKEVLIQFAEAEPEFAQAIVQSTGTFNECCKACVKGVGSSCSDKDVYQAAAQYYFPGAEVKFEMKIDLIGEASATKKSMVIDFTDFC